MLMEESLTNKFHDPTLIWGKKALPKREVSYNFWFSPREERHAKNQISTIAIYNQTPRSLWGHGKAPLELLVQLRTDLVAAIALYFPQNAFLCIMIQKWLARLLELL